MTYIVCYADNNADNNEEVKFSADTYIYINFILLRRFKILAVSKRTELLDLHAVVNISIMLKEIIGSLFAIAFLCSERSTASPLEFPRLSSTSCTDRFYAVRRHVVLDVDASNSLTVRSKVRCADDCKQLCLQHKECRSATFSAAFPAQTCYLNRANNKDDGVRTRRVSPFWQMKMFERDCSVPNPVLTSCDTQFDSEVPDTVLVVKRSHGLWEETNAPNIQSCMTLCLSHDACRSVTYQQSEQRCYLNKVNNRDDNVEKMEVAADRTITLVERQCSEPLCGIQSPLYPPKHDSSRIVGGEEANPHSWPWMVSIMDKNNTLFCGGTILSSRWIVTAAHCVYGDPSINPSLTILAGAHHRRHDETSKRVRAVARIHLHHGYRPPRRGHDLALLELATELKYTDEILPICLPRDVDISGNDCITTGWGRTKRTGNKTVLNQVHVPLIPHSVCARPEYYGLNINQDTMICAGYEHGTKDSCRGDSGGPLMCFDEAAENLSRFRLYGITSWGSGCARARKPGVYTNVRNYVTWIQFTTNNAAQIP